MPPSDAARSPSRAGLKSALPAYLGYAGLMPFVVPAAALCVPGSDGPFWSRALLGYGAVILSFVGALHWGFAMTLEGLTERRRNAALVWSNVPALLAWTALLLRPAPAALILVAGLTAQYGQDRRLARRAQLPPWYLPLRLRLTVIACVCLAVGGFAAAPI